jgi:hypothetical protein
MKKMIAIALFAAMLLALLPAASAAQITITDVSVFNYNQHGGDSYDPIELSDSYFVISAPYDEIDESRVFGLDPMPVYRVIFRLSRALDEGYDKVYVNGTRVRDRFDTVTRTEMDSTSVTCMFYAQPQGNRQTYTLTVQDGDTGRTDRYTATVVYYNTSARGDAESTWNNNIAGSISAEATRFGDHYAVSTHGQTIRIDYDGEYLSLGQVIDVDFRISDVYGYSLRAGTVARLSSVDYNGTSPFINVGSLANSEVWTGPRSGEFTVPVTIDPSNTLVSFNVTSGGNVFDSPAYNVVWRDLNQANDPASGGVSVTPSRTPTIQVGEEYVFNIASIYVGDEGAVFTLESENNSVVATATGKYLTVRGVSEGSTYVIVRDARGKVKTALYVTVKGAEAASAATPAGLPVGRVIRRNVLAK